jgi:hypothetical protein
LQLGPNLGTPRALRIFDVVDFYAEIDVLVKGNSEKATGRKRILQGLLAISRKPFLAAF